MPFKSKDQIRKFQELVKQNKMTQETFNQWMKETKDPHKLPERIGPEKPKVGIDNFYAKYGGKK